MFHNVRFPEPLAFGFESGCQFNTDVVLLASGSEQRNSRWRMPRKRYILNKNIKNKKEFIELNDFFVARGGKLHSFRFKDAADYTLDKQLIGTGDGETLVFQAVKRYVNGEYHVDKIVDKLVENTVDVYVDEAHIDAGIVVDCLLGTITFDAPPDIDARIVIDAEFDVEVRFDMDYLPFTLEEPGVYGHGEVVLLEIRD